MHDNIYYSAEHKAMLAQVKGVNKDWSLANLRRVIETEIERQYAMLKAISVVKESNPGRLP